VFKQLRFYVDQNLPDQSSSLRSNIEAAISHLEDILQSIDFSPSTPTKELGEKIV